MSKAISTARISGIKARLHSIYHMNIGNARATVWTYPENSLFDTSTYSDKATIFNGNLLYDSVESKYMTQYDVDFAEDITYIIEADIKYETSTIMKAYSVWIIGHITELSSCGPRQLLKGITGNFYWNILTDETGNTIGEFELPPCVLLNTSERTTKKAYFNTSDIQLIGGGSIDSIVDHVALRKILEHSDTLIPYYYVFDGVVHLNSDGSIFIDNIKCTEQKK